MRKIVFYCQHVLGIGHLVRSTEIIRALAGRFSVCLVSGGADVDGFQYPAGVEVVKLPALQTDADFAELQTCSGDDLEQVKEARKSLLLSVLRDCEPDAFIVELFPFGRKRFGFELLPALDYLKNSGGDTKVICSLRDILVSKQDQGQHEERVCRVVNRYFDLVLVHGDPRFQKLDETFSRVADLQCPVEYTGYVVQRNTTTVAPAHPPDHPFIVVSIGSGRYRSGHQLIESIIEAAAILQREIPHRILIFGGPFMPEDTYARLAQLAQRQPNICFERYSADLLSLMEAAALSVSMGGYNTLMNVLTTGVKAVVFPYTTNGDQEQNMRAEKLEQLGLLDVLHPEDLNARALAEKILRALDRTPARFSFAFDGAEQTAQLLEAVLPQNQPATVAP
ncbi:MAG TPA: glycosyl transferase [Solibacterales bacterium]|nr:glycosyl transferase [Bryobacterales bacterium]